LFLLVIHELHSRSYKTTQLFYAQKEHFSPGEFKIGLNGFDFMNQMIQSKDLT